MADIVYLVCVRHYGESYIDQITDNSHSAVLLSYHYMNKRNEKYRTRFTDSDYCIVEHTSYNWYVWVEMRRVYDVVAVTTLLKV